MGRLPSCNKCIILLEAIKDGKAIGMGRQKLWQDGRSMKIPFNFAANQKLL